jgi:hypothetical protein
MIGPFIFERYNDRPPCSARSAATGKPFSRHHLGGFLYGWT